MKQVSSEVIDAVLEAVGLTYTTIVIDNGKMSITGVEVDPEKAWLYERAVSKIDKGDNP